MRLYNWKKFLESKTVDLNVEIYNQYFKKKDRQSKVAWEQTGSQEKNFNYLYQFLKDGQSLLDYGCGLGDLISYLDRISLNIDYTGADINQNFINLAKETYPDNDFILIQSPHDINGKWDVVCALGVFTFFITKEDFVDTIYKLIDLCNDYVVITLLNDSYQESSNEFWRSKYRRYSQKIFEELFPDLNFQFKVTGEPYGDLIVKINKS